MHRNEVYVHCMPFFRNYSYLHIIAKTFDIPLFFLCVEILKNI